MAIVTTVSKLPDPATYLPSSGRSNYTLIVLLLAYVFSIMDRQILTLLVGPIQQSLGINDSWMGMLHGFTFATFYCLVGLPLARLIDRGNRRLIIICGIGLWCLSTAAGGLATEFWHLLLARIGVAVGEAVLLPGAVSLISDLFRSDKRDRALGIFGAAGPVGVGFGLLSTGLVLGYFTANPLTLPYLGLLEPWQATLMSVGLPGLLVMVMMIGVPEPRVDRGAHRSPSNQGAQVPLAEVLDFLKANRRAFFAVVVGAGCYYAAVYGGSAWIPSYLVREYGWSYARAGTVLGLVMLVCAPLGVIGASWLGAFWRRRGLAHSNLRVATLASVLLPLFAVPLLLAPSAHLAMPFLALTASVWTCLFGIGPAMMVEMTPAAMRGQSVALFTGVLNLLGAGIGPVMVGALTDYVFADPTAIGYSILIVTLGGCGLAYLLFRSARRHFQRSVVNADQWRTGAANDGSCTP